MLEVNIRSVFISDGNHRRNLLENITFSIKKGGVYTILGKNGSGKSTLIKSLTSLLPNHQYDVRGKVIFQGTDLLRTSSEELTEIRRKRIRYVFQDVANSLDPLKKLQYYFELSWKNQELIEEHLNFFLLPSYNKLSGMHSYELSGGMAQRFLIVLALIADPDLLILDEPTSGIDYAVANLILLKLRGYISRKDRSVLIVTQDINFAFKSSDYISYLSDGSLTKFFTRNELIKSPDDKMKNFINSFKEIDNASA